MQLFMIRHGQTAANLLNQLDTAAPGSPLDEAGQTQARALVGRWQEMGLPTPHVIYASNLQRTQETATPLAEHFGLKVDVDEGLREISAGDLEMKNDYESIVNYLDTVRQWMQGNLRLPMPGGETGAEVVARFDAAVEKAVAKAKLAAEAIGQDAHDAKIVIVAHGAVLRYWSFMRLKGTSFPLVASVPVKNTSIITAEGEIGNWRLGLWDNRPASEWPIPTNLTPEMLVPSRAHLEEAMKRTLRKEGE